MKSYLISINLLLIIACPTVMAVGYYPASCVDERLGQETSYAAIKSCFEKTIRKNEALDLSVECLTEFKVASEKFKISKTCERKASLLGPK